MPTPNLVPFTILVDDTLVILGNPKGLSREDLVNIDLSEGRVLIPFSPLCASLG